MVAGVTPPPPYQSKNESGLAEIQRWHDWFRQIDRLIEQAFLWVNINFTGSDIEDILQKDHNQLDNMQGGNSPTDTEMYHLDFNTFTELNSGLQGAYNLDTSIPQITVDDGFPLTIDLTSAAQDVFALRDEADVDIIRVSDTLFNLDVPMTVDVDYNDFAGDNVIVYNPTIPSSGVAVTSFILVQPDITIDSGIFIPSTIRDIGTYNQAVSPGFAVHTVFLGQPTLETTTAGVQPNQSFMFAAQALYENVGAGAVATPVSNIIGMTMLPRIGTRVAGDVLSVTNITGMTVSAGFATVAGSTVNLGTIRGIQINNPSVGLFQPQAGTETLTAIIGLDMSAIPFGGNVTKVAVRCSLAAATNSLFLENLGGANSQFNATHLFDVGIVQHFGDGILFSNSYGAAGGDVITYFDGTQMVWDVMSGDDLFLRFGTTSTIDHYTFEAASFGVSETAYTEARFGFDRISFGQTGSIGNQVYSFAAPNRTAGLAGGWSDVLLTQSGNLNLGVLAMSDVNAWVINAISFDNSAYTITELATLRVGGMTTSNPGGTVTERAALWVRGRHMQEGSVQYEPIDPAALAAGNTNNWAGLLTGSPNNNTRYWARITGAATATITGIDATAVQDGDTFELTNVDTTDSIDITHQDVASTAANRIITPTAVTYTLDPDETVIVRYDSTTARWRLLAGTGA